MIEAIKSVLSNKLGRWIVFFGFIVLLGAIAIGLAIDREAFFGNLFAEVAGVAMSVLIALFVVELFLEYREQEKWKLADSYMGQDLYNFAYRIRWGILSAFWMGRDFGWSAEVGVFSGDDWNEFPEQARPGGARPLTLELIAETLRKFPEEMWSELPDQIRELESSTLRTLDLYASRLSAKQFAAFLQIKSGLGTLEYHADNSPYSLSIFREVIPNVRQSFDDQKMANEFISNLLSDAFEEGEHENWLITFCHEIAPDIRDTIQATHKLVDASLGG